MQTVSQNDFSRCSFPLHLLEKSEFFDQNPDKAIEIYREFLWECTESENPIRRQYGVDFLIEDFDESNMPKIRERVLYRIQHLIKEDYFLQCLKKCDDSIVH